LVADFGVLWIRNTVTRVVDNSFRCARFGGPG
jgi:hypothetical protein